jgi:ubiquinone/menaquinone biosynthesis C-methylase UbiE
MLRPVDLFYWFVFRLCRLLEHFTGRAEMISKNRSELASWKKKLTSLYPKWYDGEISLVGVPPPEKDELITASGDKMKNAAMAWNLKFQQRKYLADLRLSKDAFAGKVICDLGAGPHPNALCFEGCEVYGTDHLMDEYRRIGYPMEEYGGRYHFVDGKLEKMPFEEGFFDAVIAVNSLDHIDDLAEASMEIRRVLKRNGLIRFIVEYHEPDLNEPIELNDDVMLHHFNWVAGFHKVHESRTDWSWGGPKEGAEAHSERRFALWSNF